MSRPMVKRTQYYWQWANCILLRQFEAGQQRWGGVAADCVGGKGGSASGVIVKWDKW